MNEHAISALLARAIQAEQALAQALAGHDTTIEIAHGLKELLAQAEQERDEDFQKIRDALVTWDNRDIDAREAIQTIRNIIARSALDSTTEPEEAEK